MCLKVSHSVGVSAWFLAMLAALLSFDTLASSMQITTADLNVNRKASVAVSVAVAAYGTPVGASYTAYVGPVADEASSKVNVSPASEVDGWTLFVAIMGLIGMRLWRVDKKSLPVIN